MNGYKNKYMAILKDVKNKMLVFILNQHMERPRWCSMLGQDLYLSKFSVI